MSNRNQVQAADKAPPGIGRIILQFIGSYALAIVIMFLLFLIVLIGTLEQGRLGLYEVQRRLFNSAFFLWEFPGGVRIPLPGGYLLMVIFAINLIVGGIVRVPWNKTKFGNLISHFGILFILLAGMVTHHYASDGHMTLAPGETSSQFESYMDWELAVVEPIDRLKQREYVIHQKNLEKPGKKSRAGYKNDQLPFELTIEQYVRNARVQRAGATEPGAVDGFAIQPLALEKEGERNLPAVRIALVDRQSGARREEILWGISLRPLTLEIGGRTFDFYLRRQSWNLPFSLTLTKFVHEYHPGTQVARTYESKVVKTESGQKQDILIRMNEPLRHKGYTFFQASFTDDPLVGVTSTLAVVRNPADHWPLVGLIIVGFGLIVHFILRLSDHLRRERLARG